MRLGAFGTQRAWVGALGVLFAIGLVAPHTAYATTAPSIVVLEATDAIDSDPLGAGHSVAVNVTGLSGPQTGVVVTFHVIAGPNAGLTGTATSTTNTCSGWAIAVFAYTSLTAGTDTIEITANVAGNLLSTSTSADWIVPSSSISLSTTSITSGQAITWSVSGFAANWEAFPPSPTVCGRVGLFHQTLVTVADSKGDTWTFSGLFPDGIAGVTFVLSLFQAFPGCIEADMTGLTLDHAGGCLVPGTISLSVGTGDTINRAIYPLSSVQGVREVEVTRDIIERGASTAFQLESSSPPIGVPEFSNSALGLVFIVALLFPILTFLRRTR